MCNQVTCVYLLSPPSAVIWNSDNFRWNLFLIATKCVILSAVILPKQFFLPEINLIENENFLDFYIAETLIWKIIFWGFDRFRKNLFSGSPLYKYLSIGAIFEIFRSHWKVPLRFTICGVTGHWTRRYYDLLRVTDTKWYFLFHLFRLQKLKKYWNITGSNDTIIFFSFDFQLLAFSFPLSSSLIFFFQFWGYFLILFCCHVNCLYSFIFFTSIPFRKNENCN